MPISNQLSAISSRQCAKLTSSSVSQSPSHSRHGLEGKHPLPESTSVLSRTDSRPWMTEAMEPPLWAKDEPSCRLLPLLTLPRTDICGNAFEELPLFWGMEESAPRRREESAVLPELSTLCASFFVAVAADAACDVPQMYNAADTATRLGGILTRMVLFFLFTFD